MKRAAALLFTGAVILSGCGDDSADATAKAVIDEAALEEGLMVTLSGNLATIDLPFSTAVPAATNDELEAELMDAVSLIVENEATGTTANLTSGSLVDTTPASAGQYTWALDTERDTLTITFYNETTNGLSLSAGTPYVAEFSVTSNEYVVNVPSMAVPVTVQ